MVRISYRETLLVVVAGIICVFWWRDRSRLATDLEVVSNEVAAIRSSVEFRRVGQRSNAQPESSPNEERVGEIRKQSTSGGKP